ncbi:SRPBCC family protein [Streptomyces sp. ME03-5684b]|uniref:SRPBCC family protein n=1 Tax=Streptomyces sp. ME03-5684b TaxID=3028681 RepID=UPI0029A38F6A|nr:SRPBCC family protein [Streptomyces sp. ME03-5684b]MDX3322857.1 SRPBCC family protein [Streptomyces sp. ME03-5684b]
MPRSEHTPRGIDKTAPVISRHSIRIAAPIDRVWQLHTDIDGWPRWQTDIGSARADGPVASGSTFHWTTAGLSISSTVHLLEAPERILWGGTAHGITALHEWRFEADGDGTLVHNEESWSGDPVDADTENLREALGQSLDSWLQHLRRTAEGAL